MVCRRVLCYVVTVSTRSIVHILVLSIVLWNFLLYYLLTVIFVVLNKCQLNTFLTLLLYLFELLGCEAQISISKRPLRFDQQSLFKKNSLQLDAKFMR